MLVLPLATLYRFKFPPRENFSSFVQAVNNPYHHKMSFRGRGNASGANRGGFGGGRGGENFPI